MAIRPGDQVCDQAWRQEPMTRADLEAEGEGRRDEADAADAARSPGRAVEAGFWARSRVLVAIWSIICIGPRPDAQTAPSSWNTSANTTSQMKLRPENSPTGSHGLHQGTFGGPGRR